jgi:uncharacterized protein DUF4386
MSAQQIIALAGAWLNSSRGKSMVVGLLYLSATLILFTTIALSGNLIDQSNAQKTGINVVLHNHQFYWLYFTTLFGAGATLGVVAMLHELLRPANARLSRVASSFGLVAALIHALGVVFLLGVDDLLTAHRYKLAFVSYEYNALGDVGMMLFQKGVFVTIFFLGIYGAFVGYLTLKSAYLPRTLGAIVGLSGSAWVIAFLPYLIGENTWAVLMLAGFVGPLSLSFWLMFKGVNMERWKAMTEPSGWDDDPPATRPSQPPVEPLTFTTENVTGRPRLVH